jgi:hypothetical protein
VVNFPGSGWSPDAFRRCVKTGDVCRWPGLERPTAHACDPCAARKRKCAVHGDVVESFAQFRALKKNGGAEVELAGESSTALLRLILLDARERRDFVAGVVAELLKEQRAQREEMARVRRRMETLVREVRGLRGEVRGSEGRGEGTSRGGMIRVERKKRRRSEAESGEAVEADVRPTKKGKEKAREEDESEEEDEEEEDGDEYSEEESGEEEEEDAGEKMVE